MLNRGDSMKKILHVFGRMNRGGAELRTKDVIESLNDKYEFHICVLSGNVGILDEKLKKSNVKIHYLPLKSPFFIIRFLKLLKRNKFDIVHSHVLYVSGFIQALAFLAGVKGRISHFRTSRDLKEINNPLRKFRNNFLGIVLQFFSTKIVYVSEVAKENLIKRKIFKNKHIVIYNGLKKPSNIDLEEKENVFTNVSRFKDSKNQLFLLDVIEVLKKYYNIDIKIQFLGNYNNEYGRKFIKEMKKRNLKDNVYLVGETSNPYPFLCKSKYFLFPSQLEGLPGALIEAHLSKCIAITSNIKENIEVNECFPNSSFTIELEKEAWAREIYNLLNNKYEIKFNNLHSFDLETCVNHFEKLYSIY